MGDPIDFLLAFSHINKLNKSTYSSGKPLTTAEENFLTAWASESDYNRYRYDRYTRRDWLPFGNIMVPENRFIIHIESLLFDAFSNEYGQRIREQYGALLMIARYVVLGLPDEEVQTLKAWAAASSLNQRVYDQFTTMAYAQQSIELVRECGSEELYTWFMQQYHTSVDHTNVFQRFFKKFKG